MMHTGDKFEAYARSARHQELRTLADAVKGLLFGSAPSRNSTNRTPANDQDFAPLPTRNDRAA